MPRPRPPTTLRQHVIRCDDELWSKVANAAKRSTCESTNAYINRVLGWAMGLVSPHNLGAGGGGAAVGVSTGSPFAAAGVTPTQSAPPTAPPAIRPFSKEQQTRRAPKGSGRPPKAKA